MALGELQNRKTEWYQEVWNYNFFDLVLSGDANFEKEIRQVFDTCFNNLQEIYTQTYNALFEKSKYAIPYRYEYKIDFIHENNTIPWITVRLMKFAASSFSIIPNDADEEKVKAVDNALRGIISGLGFDSSVRRKTLYSDCLICLLYKGVCEGLELEQERLLLHGDGMGLF